MASTGRTERERERQEMGRLNHQPEPAIHHFSHPHPLQLSNHQPQQTLNLCSGCKIKAFEWIYSCKPCNYFLHISCSQMPQQITHPFDQNHVLSLLPNPIYPEGVFNCDACGEQGNGFSYHCRECNIDLHIICASMPLLLTHQSHHHQLSLTFSPPYHNKSFSCDICKTLGSSHWLYRCNLCEFDAHLRCAMMKPRASIRENQIQQYQTTPRASPHYQVVATQYATGPPLQTYLPNNYVNNANPSTYGSGMPIGRSGQGNGLLNQALQGLFSGASQALGQNLLQGIMGGDGGNGSSGSGDGGGLDVCGGDSGAGNI